GILIKDNHLAALRSLGLNLKEIIARARQNASQRLKIEVEAKTVREATEAAEAGADIVMLDNMSLEDMHQAIKLIQGRALIEASGGVTLDKVRAIAETGVDFISVGALTHSARALDISLKLE
ncbi:MAG: nicotinate-nucleotide diphosphorylase (carboxylating), partial [Dehalococcoidia bacterium]|nr:nicotinate-nucleotide diphosphorylase (carboxylating) [Dehalococcoidia bacterium]